MTLHSNFPNKFLVFAFSASRSNCKMNNHQAECCKHTHPHVSKHCEFKLASLAVRICVQCGGACHLSSTCIMTFQIVIEIQSIGHHCDWFASMPNKMQFRCDLNAVESFMYNGHISFGCYVLLFRRMRGYESVSDGCKRIFRFQSEQHEYSEAEFLEKQK